jgi:hypothetical protein
MSREWVNEARDILDMHWSEDGMKKRLESVQQILRDVALEDRYEDWWTIFDRWRYQKAWFEDDLYFPKHDQGGALIRPRRWFAEPHLYKGDKRDVRQWFACRVLESWPCMRSFTGISLDDPLRPDDQIVFRYLEVYKDTHKRYPIDNAIDVKDLIRLGLTEEQCFELEAGDFMEFIFFEENKGAELCEADAVVLMKASAIKDAWRF